MCIIDAGPKGAIPHLLSDWNFVMFTIMRRIGLLSSNSAQGTDMTILWRRGADATLSFSWRGGFKDNACPRLAEMHSTYSWPVNRSGLALD